MCRLIVAIFCLPQYHVYLWGLLGLGSAAAIVIWNRSEQANSPDQRGLSWHWALRRLTFGDISYDVLTKLLA